MLQVRKYVLVENYKLDSSMVYGCTAEELQVLVAEMGELEPIIDAINVLSGASIEQRARDIGCSPSDFWYEEEEKRKILREGQTQEEALFSALDQYVMVLDEEMGYDVPREQLKAKVLNFVDGYFVDTAQASDDDAREKEYAAGRPWEHN